MAVALAGNRLLERLPLVDRSRLGARLTRVTLGHGTLAEPTTRLGHAYFPIRGLISIMAPLEDGRAIEVATIGPEGMAGVGVVLGASRVRHGIVSQIAGESLVVTALALTDELDRSAALRSLLELYTVVYLAQLAQTAACNAAHAMRQRLVHLLLLCHDAALADTFATTQEFLAGMLGVQRPGVSLIAEALRREGTIAYKRGTVRVLDRQALESASCECYAAGRAEYDRILG